MNNSPTSSTRQPRRPLPEPLPENEYQRALLIGAEASRWLPFDPVFFLERLATVGAPAGASDRMVWYSLPRQPSPEYEFLCGWRCGCPGADAMVIKALAENDELRLAHQKLAQLEARSND